MFPVVDSSTVPRMEVSFEGALNVDALSIVNVFEELKTFDLAKEKCDGCRLTAYCGICDLQDGPLRRLPHPSRTRDP